MSDEDDGSSLSSIDLEPRNPPVSSSIGKHIYFDDEEHDDQSTQKIIERETPSTIRVDSSDLITRCKDFLPLLGDVNQKEVSTEKDDDEINIPEINSKESGEVSSTSDDDDEKSKDIEKKKRKKKKKKKKKKLKTDENLIVNNQDLK
jgi:hypothetical protein